MAVCPYWCVAMSSQTRRSLSADRFSVKPPTTWVSFPPNTPDRSYLEKGFIKLLDDPNPRLEYQQVNLSNMDRLHDVLTPPAHWNDKTTGWERFDVVYDLTGDTSFDKPELVMNPCPGSRSQTDTDIQHISASAILGQIRRGAATGSQARGLCPAHLSLLRDEVVAILVAGACRDCHSAPRRCPREMVARGVAWPGAGRGVEHRGGSVWSVVWTGQLGRGSHTPDGSWSGVPIPPRGDEVSSQVSIIPTKPLTAVADDSADLRINTVHSVDVAQALHRLSLYLLNTPRDKVMSESAVDLGFSFVSPPSPAFSLTSGKRSSISDAWRSVSTVVPEQREVSIPLFNVVDDNDSTQEKLASAVATLWGIDYGFINSTVASLVQQFSKASVAICCPPSDN